MLPSLANTLAPPLDDRQEASYSISLSSGLRRHVKRNPADKFLVPVNRQTENM